MAIIKRIKNNSGADKFIITRVIPDQGYYDVGVKYWVQILDNVDLLADIASGVVIVNDGTSDLSATDGLKWVTRFQEYQPLTGGGNSVIGTVHQLAFSGIGNNKNKWLVLYGDNKKKSNEAPGVMMWSSKLVGLSFSNERKSIETDIQIHVSSDNDGASPTTTVFTWQVRNSRVCRKTNFSPDITFAPGDKVAIYLKDQGTDPKDVTVVMYFQVIADNSEEVCKTYSGDFSIAGAGTGSS